MFFFYNFNIFFNIVKKLLTVTNKTRINILVLTILRSIVLKLGSARWVDPRPSWPKTGTGPSWRKNKERKNQVRQVDLVTRLTLQNLVKSCLQTRWLLYFLFYFTKTIILRLSPVQGPSSMFWPGQQVGRVKKNF